jgi:hypothetical protein
LRYVIVTVPPAPPHLMQVRAQRLQRIANSYWRPEEVELVPAVAHDTLTKCNALPHAEACDIVHIESGPDPLNSTPSTEFYVRISKINDDEHFEQLPEGSFSCVNPSDADSREKCMITAANSLVIGLNAHFRSVLWGHSHR